MLTIRPAQLQVLEQHQLTRYHERLRRFFQETIPEALRPRSKAENLRVIADSVESGTQLGVTEDAVMARYVALHFYLQGSVLDVPPAKKYLESSDLEPNARVRVLCDQLEEYLRRQGR